MPSVSVILPIHGVDFAAMARAARAAETLDYCGIWVPDHLLNASRPERGVLECWTVLSALAALTSAIRIGTLVLTTPFRQPALLAKQAATLDSVAPGRIHLGLGSGGFTYEETCRQFGFPRLSPAARVAHCRETIECLRATLTEDPATRAGRFLNVEQLRIHPRPATRIPLTLAARRPGMMALAAAAADGWNCPLPQELGDGLVTLERLGRDRDTIHVSVFSVLVAGRTEAGAAAALRRAGPQAQLFGNVETHHLYGAPSRLLDGLATLFDQGADEVAIDIRGAPVEAVLQLLAEEVLPHLPSAGSRQRDATS